MLSVFRPRLLPFLLCFTVFVFPSRTQLNAQVDIDYPYNPDASCKWYMSRVQFDEVRLLLQGLEIALSHQH